MCIYNEEHSVVCEKKDCGCVVGVSRLTLKEIPKCSDCVAFVKIEEKVRKMAREKKLLAYHREKIEKEEGPFITRTFIQNSNQTKLEKNLVVVKYTLSHGTPADLRAELTSMFKCKGNFGFLAYAISGETYKDPSRMGEIHIHGIIVYSNKDGKSVSATTGGKPWNRARPDHCTCKNNPSCSNGKIHKDVGILRTVGDLESWIMYISKETSPVFEDSASNILKKEDFMSMILQKKEKVEFEVVEPFVLKPLENLVTPATPTTRILPPIKKLEPMKTKKKAQKPKEETSDSESTENDEDDTFAKVLQRAAKLEGEWFSRDSSLRGPPPSPVRTSEYWEPDLSIPLPTSMYGKKTPQK